MPRGGPGGGFDGVVNSDFERRCAMWSICGGIGQGRGGSKNRERGVDSVSTRKRASLRQRMNTSCVKQQLSEWVNNRDGDS